MQLAIRNKDHPSDEDDMPTQHHSSRRQRASRSTGQRTRTGCLTCKQRRVKCDEEKPFCRRCVEGGHRCGGYPEAEPVRRGPSRSPSVAGLGPGPGVSTAAASRATTPLAAPAPPLTRIAWTAAERRAIELALRQLSGQSSFWTQQAGPLAQHEAAVKHALAALGAVCEARQLGGKRRGAATAQAAARRFALQQYNRSIQALGSRVQSAAASSTSTALACCVIFVTLELLQRNNDQALKHLRAGLRIYASQRRGARSPASDAIGELLFRLDAQATDYLDSRRPLLVPGVNQPSPPGSSGSSGSEGPAPGGASPASPSPSSPSPMAGTPLAALRTRLDDIHKKVQLFRIDNQMYAGLPRARVPDDVLLLHASLLEELQDLGIVLAALDISPDSLRLIVAHRSLAAMLQAGHVDGPWPALNPLFVSVLDAAEPLLAADPGAEVLELERLDELGSFPEQENEPFAFTLDATLVPALFFVAHAAPLLATRDRAVQCLRRARAHEGLWHSAIAADIASRCLADERGRLSPCVPENIPQLACRLGVAEGGGLEPLMAEAEA